MTSDARLDIARQAILVIHPGALGDVLLARPVLRTFRNQFPQHELALLAGESVGVLLRNAGEVDRVFPLESKHMSELYAGVDGLHPAFRSWLGKCTIAVGWLQDTEGTMACTLRASGVQSACLKSSQSSDILAEHQSVRYFEALGLEGDGEDTGNGLFLPPIVCDRGEGILRTLKWHNQRPLVVIHPGSGSARKCVEAWRLARVIEWLSQAGMTPMLLEGPADAGPVTQVLANVTIPVPVIRNLDLSTAAGVLSHAELYLGHDSGMTHLAAALSIPTVACFGPTNPRRWGPLGRSVSIVLGAPCTCVMEEYCRDRVCLQIAPDRIIDACRSLLVRRSTFPSTNS